MKEVWQEIMQGMAVKIIVLTLLLLGIILFKFVMSSSSERMTKQQTKTVKETPPISPTQTNFTL